MGRQSDAYFIAKVDKLEELSRDLSSLLTRVLICEGKCPKTLMRDIEDILVKADAGI